MKPILKPWAIPLKKNRATSSWGYSRSASAQAGNLNGVEIMEMLSGKGGELTGWINLLHSFSHSLWSVMVVA